MDVEDGRRTPPLPADAAQEWPAAGSDPPPDGPLPGSPSRGRGALRREWVSVPVTARRTATGEADGRKGPRPAGDAQEAPLPARARRESPSPAEGGGAELRASPNKNRLLQLRRAGGRKLFGKERRETFLEWFAATCNVRLAAEKAEICYQTVFRHRMKDAAFAAAWDEALAQGYARIEARLLQEAMPPGAAGAGGEALEVRGDLDGPEVEAAFDRELAIVLLREHARRRAGSPDKRKHFRTNAETASNQEIAEALAKRLKGFALRRAAAQAPQVEGETARALPGADAPDEPERS